MSRKPLLKKTKQIEVNTLLEYIQQNTEDTNNWIPISSRIVYNLFNFSQGHFLSLIEAIKEHPNILYEIDESFPTRFKPYKFRWTNNLQEKLNQELTYKHFFWLTAEEIIYIKETIQIDEFMELSKVLKLCNLLAGEKAKEYWVSINIEELSDLVLLTFTQTRDKINLLVEKNLLVKSEYSNYYRLVLNSSFLQDIIAESQQKTVAIKPKFERKKQKHTESKTDIPTENTKESAETQLKTHAKIYKFELLQKSEPNSKSMENINLGTIETTVPSSENTFQNNLESNIQLVSDSNIYGIHNNNDVIKHIIDNVQAIEQFTSNLTEEFHKYSGFLKQFREQNKENYKSHETFIKLLKEYENLQLIHEQTKKSLCEYEIKIRKFEHEIKSLCKNHEEFLINAQMRIDVLLGEISGLIDKFVAIPTYKMDEVITARLKKDVWQSTMRASDEIMQFKPESKLAPDLN